MKVSFIFPNGFLGRRFRWDVPMHPPLSLAYLASITKEAGHDVQVVDAMAENLGLKPLFSRLNRFHPDVIGITANVSVSRKAELTARYAKKLFPRAVVIMGGPWSTIEYEKVMDLGDADIVVLGEGEETLRELLGCIHAPKKWHLVKGIAFRDESGKVVLTPRRQFIENLDSLPFPSWELFPDTRKYNFNTRGNPFYPVMTSRGCPYDCMHCTKVVHGYKYRMRSPENVLAELEYLKERFNVKVISFVDDTFTQDVSRAEKILDGMIQRRLGIKFMFSNGVRADTITRRLVKKLKAAGCYYAGIGIESGNQRVVNQIGKRLDLRKAIEAIKLFREYGIITGAYFIFGHPHDTKKTMMDTLVFARSLNADYSQFFKAVPFPGTKMHELIQEEGTFLQRRKEWNVDGYNMATASFKIWDCNPDDVEEVFKKSYRYFYLNPRKILTLISQIRSFPEIKWFIKSIVQIFLKNLV